MREAARFARHLANLHSLRLVKERVFLDRLESIVLRAPSDSAERALAAIVASAAAQREELEDVLLAWKRSFQTGSGPEAGAPAPVPYAEVLESLARVLRQAADIYESAARDCPDPVLAERLARLASEDRDHALVLDELLTRA